MPVISLSALLVSCALLVVAGAALAKPADKKKKDPAQKATLGVVTGPKTGTYYQVGLDIASVMPASVKLDVKASDGSVDNIRRINSKENAALGIVQSDILSFLSRSRHADSLKMAGNLRMVLPLFPEEVHVLASKSVTEFSSLQGKRVVVGEEGSGHMLTALNLLTLLDVKPAELIKVSPAEGVVQVMSGEADAMIYVGGKPVKLLKNLADLPSRTKDASLVEALNRVHFVALDDPKLLNEYAPATLNRGDYGFMDGDVPSVAATSVLVSYNFSENGKSFDKRCKAIGEMADAVRSALPKLKETGHPKWKEVRIDDAPTIWQKDRCAWPNADKKNGSFMQDLESVIQQKPAHN